MNSLFYRLQNALRIPFLKYRKEIQVHLGCGQERIPGFINIDERVTSATDYLVNLNNITVFGEGNVKCFFSHAFLEHLLRNQRLGHLKKIYEALKSDGFCCYIGIPYFPTIAKFYLDGGAGIVGEKFDLFNVYRFTHGDPELAKGGWVGRIEYGKRKMLAFREIHSFRALVFGGVS